MILVAGRSARIRRVASGPVIPGQPDVHQHQIRFQALGQCNGFLARRRLPDQPQPGRGPYQQRGGPAERHLVVDHQYPQFRRCRHVSAALRPGTSAWP